MVFVIFFVSVIILSCKHCLLALAAGTVRLAIQLFHRAVLVGRKTGGCRSHDGWLEISGFSQR